MDESTDVVIEMSAPPAGRGWDDVPHQVHVNGQKIPGARVRETEQVTGHRPRVTLELVATSVEVRAPKESGS